MRSMVMTVAVAFGFSVTALSQEPNAIGTAQNQWAILATTVIGFLSLLVTQGFAMRRESRNRKWDIEDRQAARLELKKQAEAQRLETVSTAIELARISNINRKHVVNEIQKNTELTQEVGTKAAAAYEIGNNFNQKLDALRKELQDKQGQMDHVEEVSDDTHAKVEHIDAKVTKLKESTS